MSKFQWDSNLEHKLCIFEIAANPAKICVRKILRTRKTIYAREIAAVNLSKISFLKNAKKRVNQTTAI